MMADTRLFFSGNIHNTSEGTDSSLNQATGRSEGPSPSTELVRIPSPGRSGIRKNTERFRIMTNSAASQF